METTDSFFDETPTPTRLIRNCEEIGLFQDLHHNPFDETFRIAVESSNNDISNVLKESFSKQVVEESLNTPKIITVSKPENFHNIYSIIEEDDDNFITPDAFIIESVDSGSPQTCLEKENNSDDSADIEIIEEPVQENSFIVETSNLQSANFNSVVSVLASNCPSNVTYTVSNNSIKNGNIGNIVIQNRSSASTSNIPHNNTNAKQFVIQKSLISTRKDETEKVPKSNLSSVLKSVSTSSNSNFLYQLSNNKLPTLLSGKNVVILPSRNIASKASLLHPTNNLSKKDENEKYKKTDFEVKKKLRNLLRTNSNQLVDDTIMIEEERPTGVKEFHSSINLMDEKREHSRERNRMAQKRCRMKKKRWIMQLKKETESVLNENQNLQVEVSSLRAEIAHLKTLLLAHRNCSVTRAMYKADLSAIMNNDVSSIAENIEIPVPDSTDSCEESEKIKYNNVVSHQQFNQVNHHVNHFHVHVSPSAHRIEDTLESICSRNGNGQPVVAKLHNSHSTQNKRLIFDSKVVPIKLNERSANIFQKSNKPKTINSNTVTVKNVQEKSQKFLNGQTISTSRCREMSEMMVIDDNPTQSTEISGSINNDELKRKTTEYANIKWSSNFNVEKINL